MMDSKMKPREKSTSHPMDIQLANQNESPIPQTEKILTGSPECGSRAHRNSNNYNTSTSGNRNQFSSFILFISVIIIVNLCPFQHPTFEPSSDSDTRLLSDKLHQEMPATGNGQKNYLNHIETCGNFMRLMFTNPVRLGKRTTRFIRADAMARRGNRHNYGYQRPSQVDMYHHHYHQQQAPMYHYGLAAANQIINHYKPSPPTYVDHADGLYGQYNNAYGRQDANYHLW